MAKSLYELEYGFEAPDLLKSEQVGSIITQFFEKGKVFLAEPYKKDRIIVEKRFVFPIEIVKKSDRLSNLKIDDALLPKKEDDNSDFTGESPLTLKDKISEESKTFKNGALLGLAVGILSALYFQKSVLWFSIFGVAIGGYVAKEVNKSKSKDLGIKTK